MAEILGGAKLDAALAAMAKGLKTGSAVKVGFLENATYPDGTKVAMIAAIQEFGAPKKSIPPRPFFRHMVEKESGAWPDELATQLKLTNYDVSIALGRMGELLAGQLRQSIIETNSPPLSVLTLRIRAWKAAHPNEDVTGKIVGELAAQAQQPFSLKGVSTKPLVDTGVMLGAIDYEVSE